MLGCSLLAKLDLFGCWCDMHFELGAPQCDFRLPEMPTLCGDDALIRGGLMSVVVQSAHKNTDCCSRGKPVLFTRT